MITGLTKKEKTTEIFFDEAGAFITVRTHNTDLKNRLSRYRKHYPDECRLVQHSKFKIKLNTVRSANRQPPAAYHIKPCEAS